MLGRPMQRDWDLPSSALSSSSSLTQCVRRFGHPDSRDPYAHIVAAKLSPTRPRDLLVSYSAKGVYLFDTDADTVDKQAPPLKKKKRISSSRRERDLHDVLDESNRGDDSDDEVVGIDEGARSAAAGRPAKRTRERSLPQPLAGPSSSTIALAQLPKRPREDVEQGEAGSAARTGSPTSASGLGGEEELEHLQSDERDNEEERHESSEGDEGSGEEDGSGSGSDDEPETVDDPFAGEPKYSPDAPLVAPFKHYVGHANTQVRTLPLLLLVSSRLD